MRVQTTVQSRLYPCGSFKDKKALQDKLIPPRVCRACRPTPCRHSACK